MRIVMYNKIIEKRKENHFEVNAEEILIATLKIYEKRTYAHLNMRKL